MVIYTMAVHATQVNTLRYTTTEEWGPVVVYAGKEFYLEYTTVEYTINKFYQLYQCTLVYAMNKVYLGYTTVMYTTVLKGVCKE